MRRPASALGILALLVAGLAAATAGSTPPVSAAGTFTERWCHTHAAPCVESFTINGTPQTADSPVEIQLHGPTDLGDYREINLELGGAAPAVSDVLSVVIRTGKTFVPDRMFGRMGLDDVDAWRGGDDHWRMRITGSPVVWPEGCDENTPWPWKCEETSPSDPVVFGADIGYLEDRRDSSIGMYVGTNAPYNGIFLVEQADGTHALTTQLVAPHFHQSGASVVGDISFRLSYDQMRSDMDIPNPATLTPTSLTGTINGGTGGGTFTTWHDPDGGGFLIRASGFTFSVKRIKVAAAKITPTRPRITHTKRVTTSRAKVVHTLSRARGAKVTGYTARCVNRAGHRVTGNGAATSRKVVVIGLRAGSAYQCKVAARSKAGRSAWSPAAKIARRPS